MSFDGRERGGADVRDVESPIPESDNTVIPAPVIPEPTARTTDHERIAGGSPYRPLTPYTEDDADLFFGRTGLWRRLHVRAVPGGGVVTVVGPSGAGKTSLIRAGLIPEVRRSGLRRGGERIPASVVMMTPGSDPMASLAGALANRPDPVDGSACLVVVDQAEELFSICTRTERAEFLAEIDALADDAGFAVVVVLRADFYARAVDEPVLVGTLDDRAVVVRTMGEHELRTAVVEPAGARGVTVDDAAVAAIITDLGAVNPGTPPLIALGVLMDHLWRTRADTTITLAAFRASDPLESIVESSAERAWTRLTEADRRTARLVLLACVRVTDSSGGTAGDVVASEVTLADLRTRLDRHHRLDTVVAHLVDAGLVRVTADRLGLTHDSLVTAWSRPAQWVTQRRAGAPIRTAVIADAARWDAGGHPRDELYDTARLRSAQRSVEPIDVLGPAADAFLSRSRERASLRRSRRRVLLGALVVVAVVSLVVAITAVIRGNDAATERDAARTDAAIARIGATAADDPTESARLALDAYRRTPTDPRAESALLATQSTPLARPLADLPAAVAVATTGSPTSDRVALVAADGSIRLTSTAIGAPVTATIAAGTSSLGPQGVAIDRGAALLAAPGIDGAVRLWRIDAAGATTELPAVSAISSAPVVAVTFSADRPLLSTVSADGSVRVVDVSDPPRSRVIATLPVGSAARAAVFGAGGGADTLIVGSADRRISAWDLTNPRSPVNRFAQLTLDNPVTALATSADGRTLAAADAAGTVALADLDTDGLSRVGPGLGRTGPLDPGVGDTVVGVSTLSFAPTGHRLAVTSADGSTRIWDTTHTAFPRVLTGDLRSVSTTIGAARFTGDSTVVTTGNGVPQAWSLPGGLLDGGFGGVATPACSTVKGACVTTFVDGPVQVWNAADPTAPVQLGVIDAPDHFDGSAMSPDGLWMMTVDAAHRAQLWDVSQIARPVAVGPAVSLGSQPVGTVRFSPSSRMLAMSVDGNSSVGVWSVDRRGLTRVADLGLDGAPVTTVAFSGDSGQIALGGAPGVIRTRLDASGTGQVSGRLQPGSPVTAVAYVGDDVVVGDSTGGVTRYRSADGGQVGARTPLGRWAVTSIVALGSTTATASADGTITRIGADGDVRRVGNLYGASSQGPARVTAIGDDTALVTGDGGSQQFWSLRTSEVAAAVCTATASSGC